VNRLGELGDGMINLGELEIGALMVWPMIKFGLQVVVEIADSKDCVHFLLIGPERINVGTPEQLNDKIAIRN